MSSSIYQEALSFYNQGDYEGAWELLHGAELKTEQERFLLKECEKIVVEQAVFILKSYIEEGEIRKAKNFRLEFYTKYGYKASIGAIKIPECTQPTQNYTTPTAPPPPKPNATLIENKKNHTLLFSMIGVILAISIGYVVYMKWIENSRTINDGESKVQEKEGNFIPSDNLENESNYSGYYEGTMAGFPMTLYMNVDENKNIAGQYRNVKYGTVLPLSGKIESDGTFQITASNQSETIYFILTYRNGSLDGFGSNESNRLDVSLMKKEKANPRDEDLSRIQSDLRNQYLTINGSRFPGQCGAEGRALRVFCLLHGGRTWLRFVFV